MQLLERERELQREKEERERESDVRVDYRKMKGKVKNNPPLQNSSK